MARLNDGRVVLDIDGKEGAKAHLEIPLGWLVDFGPAQLVDGALRVESWTHPAGLAFVREAARFMAGEPFRAEVQINGLADEIAKRAGLMNDALDAIWFRVPVSDARHDRAWNRDDPMEVMHAARGLVNALDKVWWAIRGDSGSRWADPDEVVNEVLNLVGTNDDLGERARADGHVGCTDCATHTCMHDNGCAHGHHANDVPAATERVDTSVCEIDGDVAIVDRERDVCAGDGPFGTRYLVADVELTPERMKALDAGKALVVDVNDEFVARVVKQGAVDVGSVIIREMAHPKTDDEPGVDRPGCYTTKPVLACGCARPISMGCDGCVANRYYNATEALRVPAYMTMGEANEHAARASMEMAGFTVATDPSIPPDQVVLRSHTVDGKLLDEVRVVNVGTDPSGTDPFAGLCEKMTESSGRSVLEPGGLPIPLDVALEDERRKFNAEMERIFEPIDVTTARQREEEREIEIARQVAWLEPAAKAAVEAEEADAKAYGANDTPAACTNCPVVGFPDADDCAKCTQDDEPAVLSPRASVVITSLGTKAREVVRFMADRDPQTNLRILGAVFGYEDDGPGACDRWWQTRCTLAEYALVTEVDRLPHDAGNPLMDRWSLTTLGREVARVLARG